MILCLGESIHNYFFFCLQHIQISMFIQRKRARAGDDVQLVSKRTKVTRLTSFPLGCVHSLFEVSDVLDIVFTYEAIPFVCSIR